MGFGISLAPPAYLACLLSARPLRQGLYISTIPFAGVPQKLLDVWDLNRPWFQRMEQPSDADFDVIAVADDGTMVMTVMMSSAVLTIECDLRLYTTQQHPFKVPWKSPMTSLLPSSY